MKLSIRLRTEILFAVFLVCSSVLLAQTFIRHVYTLPALQSMAAQQDSSDIKLVASQFRQQVAALETLLYDNAVWDEFYKSTLQHDVAWFEENYFIEGSYGRLGINGWYFYDKQQHLITGRSLAKTGDVMDKNLFDDPMAPVTQTLLKNDADVWPRSYFLMVNDRPVLAVAHSILRSDEQGPSAGTAIVWTFIDEQFVESITPGLVDDITLIVFDSDKTSDTVHAFYDDIDQHSYTHDSDYLVMGVRDYRGTPLFGLSVPRRPQPFDSSLFDSSLIAGLLISAGVLLLFYLWINKKLVTPVSRLFSVISYSIAHGDYSKRTQLPGSNEVSRLGQQLDGLLNLVQEQQRELLCRNESLEKISLTDSLTGLGNRRAMDTYLQSVALLNRTTAQHFALLILDIDFFKNYNDHYGHAQGDEALALIAELLKSRASTAHSRVFRYGGEEFVIMLENTSIRQAMAKAQDIVSIVREARIAHEARGDKERVITISAGLTVKPTDLRLNAAALFEAADSALYQAKNMGRNQVQTVDDVVALK
ncbi:sensor domain-containing diguanylate cyclase [Salinimonas lutimaris]|uniref:sensor domain-containing diguanylate cyclase n=1 Tax=Salinimonas lutimaris TaxID=914153 RepID=UPI0010C0841B|nr:diguanylate cyclase [Salinimonas lutimaris]